MKQMHSWVTVKLLNVIVLFAEDFSTHQMEKKKLRALIFLHYKNEKLLFVLSTFVS